MNTKELVKKLTAGMPKPIDNSEQRRQARADYSRGKSYSGFDRLHGEQRPNRKVWSLFDSHNFSMDTDTTGFKELNQQQRESSEERRTQERERVDCAIEQHGQGAPVEDQEFFEAEESALVEERRHSRPVGLEAVNQEYARRRGYQLPRVS